MKKLIELKLKILAKWTIAKYKPKIIGITGSVGKTSAKEAIYTVLKKKYNVRRSIKNYNNEIGLPLTVLGLDSPARSIFGWVNIFIRALLLLLFKDKDYPKILVLEMGVDRPGDMEYLTSIAIPEIGVVTLIGTVHVEYFGTTKKLREEKAKLIKAVPKSGQVIINYDNEGARKIIDRGQASVTTYGLDRQADLRAREIKYSFEECLGQNELKGVSFKMEYKGSCALVFLPNVIGLNAVYAALAGAAVGLAKGLNLAEISKALKGVAPSRGRTNLITGIKGTIIIDDTYNSEPESARAALGIIKRLPVIKGARKIVIFGDMLELGSFSEEAHQHIGQTVVKFGMHKLITVGERARDIARGAEEAGMRRDDIFSFGDSESAGKFVQDRIKRGDLILVKGSQGIRTEKIVKEIMAEPMRAKELLVRQDKDWVGK
ncbi:UDP-N-acetylmuramoyl-tripeptide--D-alanyl-D-alanine ligase [bacterium]|nr:UDP-N-acetylmuramoyl-tripeptide--D-alanyl-D-alanine ligase [bacterium]